MKLFIVNLMLMILPLETSRYAISGSFGEYRPTHLHAGVDFATFGRTGLPVRAIDAGVVYRIRSSAGGYGNVVYLEHSNGLRSVYAHMERFSPKIARALPRPAHPLGGDSDAESMQVWPAEQVRVAKGEVIGWSGESGAGSPHLHFELRDANDRPLNPVAHGIFDVRDEKAPTLRKCIIEPFDASAFPRAPRDVERGAIVGAKGRIRILLDGYDEDGFGGGVLGLTKIRLLIDGACHTEINMRKFSYDRSNEVGSVYDLYRTGFGPAAYTHDLTGSDGAAEVVIGGGAVTVDRNQTIVIEAYDLKGNRSIFDFQIRLSEEDAATAPDYIGRAQAVLPAHPSGITTMAPGVKVSGIPRDARVGGRVSSTFETPAQAVARPVLLGPFGLVLSRGAEIAMDPSGGANGIAQYRNGSWKWLGRNPTNIAFLAPVVLVRDTAPPVAKRENGTITIRDDFSGVDGESVRVRGVRGRFDSDRDRFVPDTALDPEKQYDVEAADRAGNRMKVAL